MEKLSVILFIVFLINREIAALSSSSEFYQVESSEAYQWKSSFPQSCSCAESGVTSSSCDLFRCNCLCDTTAGICDYGCCCDPDCTSDQISRFSSLNVCAYEGGSSDTTEYCYKSTDLYAVNPKSPMKGTPTAEEGLNRALCVEKRNYAIAEDFFTDDDMQSSSVFQQSSGQKDYSYTTINEIETSTVVADNYYDQNDTISAFMNSTAIKGLVSNGPGFLQLPTADYNGECNDNNYAKFEVGQSAGTTESNCIRTFPTTKTEFESQCVSQQSVSRYVTDLWIAKSANIMATSGAWSTNQLLNVELASVMFEDILTQQRTAVTESWLTNQCSTSYVEGSTLLQLQANGCSFSSTSTKATLVTSSSSLCLGAIKAVTYTVYHAASAAGTITNVTADVILTDIPMVYDSTAVQYTQSFLIYYASWNNAGQSSTNGNLVTRKRSGNPGYLMGAPVLYGYQNDSKTIRELKSGLTIPTSTASNVCPTSASEIVETPTSFGYDSITGCNMKLSRQDMINLCCSGAPGTCLDNSIYTVIGSSPYLAANGLPYFFNFTQGYVGIYGDADPLDITQWFPITYTVPTDSRTWNDKTATCSNMYSGLNIQLLVSYSGERMDPQNKIVTALAEVVTSDWIFRVPAGDNTTTQAFQFSVVVSYIFSIEEKLKNYEPPAPPALFKVPYDVFYPFVVNSAERSSRLFSIPSLFCLFCLCLYFAF